MRTLTFRTALTDYEHESIRQIFKELLTGERGLTEEQARERIVRYGRNAIAAQSGFQFGRFAREQAFNRFNLLLAGAAVISFVSSEHVTESLIIFGFLCLSILISAIEEVRYIRLYETLTPYLQKKTEVIRSGKRSLISADALVPGDLIYLTKGERVPADCIVLHALNLNVDESLLTGESDIVPKGEREPLYSGTVISDGEAEAIAVFTAGRTRFSHIANLAFASQKQSAYQRNLDQFSAQLTKFVAGFAVIIFAAHSVFSDLAPSEVLLFTLILGLSIIPEFLPPITATALAYYTHVFVRKHVLVKRLTAIEDLGVIDILCVDKTGTLTTNTLALEHFDSPHKDLFVYFAFSLSWGMGEKHLSDFEEALVRAYHPRVRAGGAARGLLVDRRLFDPHMRVSQGIVQKGRKRYFVLMGSPELILQSATLPKKEANALRDRITAYSQEGLRILAASYHELPGVQYSFFERAADVTGNFTYLGMAAFRDALKPTARAAIRDAEALGVDVRMLTGDRPEVARKVAHEAGLIGEDEPVYTEDDLASLSEAAFADTVERGHVFSRLRPEMKYKIVRALQKRHLVGFLGEGINDIPVLKIANVGIAVDMAVDASKDVADLIMRERGLHVIVDGIRLGRAAFYNILKYLKHTMSDNFGNSFSVGVLSIFITFLPLLPIQILLTNLLTDLPLFGVVFDRVEEREVRQRPRYGVRELALLLMSLGIVAALFNLIVYLFYRGARPDVIRTALFLQTTVSGLVIFYSIRTSKWLFQSRPAMVMHIVTFVAFLLTLLVLQEPFASYFSFTPLRTSEILWILILNTAFLAVNDIVKKMVARSRDNARNMR